MADQQLQEPTQVAALVRQAVATVALLNISHQVNILLVRQGEEAEQAAQALPVLVLDLIRV